MSNRIMRENVSGDNVESKIREGLRFVPISNNIFDEFYSKDELEYHPLHDESPDIRRSLCNNKDGKFRMSELDLIVLIFIYLLNFNKINLSNGDIAKYLGCSKKALETSVKKLQRMKGYVTTRPIHTQKHVKLSERQFAFVTDVQREYDTRHVSLLTSKQYHAYTGVYDPVKGKDTIKKGKTSEWYVDYECEWSDFEKKEKSKTVTKWKRINFFFVTIDDFFYLDRESANVVGKTGKSGLNRIEFITYLYLIRRDSKDGGCWLSNQKIADDVRVKQYERIVEYLDNIESFGLVNITLPQNYHRKLEVSGEDPSRMFKPIVSYKSIGSISGTPTEMENNQILEEVNLFKKEVKNKKKEVKFDEEEVNIFEREVNFRNKEVDFDENEVLPFD